MGMPAASAGWATPEEWAANRDIIAGLYIDEKRKLKDVMRIMREEHGFHATEKMYKIRLNKWGLQKYLRHQTPESFKHGRRALGKQAEQFLDRALPIQQRPLNVASVGTGSTAITSPRPMTPRLLSSPDQWKLPEECIFIAQNYILGTNSAGTWAPSSNMKFSLTWVRQVAIASNVLSHSITQQGFHMLEVCFANLKRRLSEADTNLLSDILCAIAQLSRSSDELVDVFLNYALGLCTILHPVVHPIRQLLTNLHKQGWSNIKPHLHTLLNAYWETARTHGKLEDSCLDIMETQSLFLGTIAGWLNPADAIKTMQAALQRRKANNPDDIRITQMVQGHIILMLYHGGQFEEAKSTSLELLEHEPHYFSARTNAYATLTGLAMKEDNLDEAIAWARKNFDFAMESWGPQYHRTAQTILELVMVLWKANRIDEAKELVKLFDITWEEFCEQIEKARARNGKRFRARPSLMHIKGCHSRFQEAFDEMIYGDDVRNPRAPEFD